MRCVQKCTPGSCGYRGTSSLAKSRLYTNARPPPSSQRTTSTPVSSSSPISSITSTVIHHPQPPSMYRPQLPPEQSQLPDLAQGFDNLSLSPPSHTQPNPLFHPFQPPPDSPLYTPDPLYPHQNFYEYEPLPQEPSSLPTDAEISRRARAACGLDVTAPAFIPSFAASPPEQHSHPQQPPVLSRVLSEPVCVPNADVFAVPESTVYNNVTTLLPITPLPHTPPAEPPTVEKAVNIFENEFPSLHAANPTVSNTPPRKSTAPPEPTAVALGWHALQREEEAKKREEEHHKRSLLLWQQAVDGLCQEDEPDEAPITNDVGNIWVSTGASVASLYTELRAEAAKQASIRNMYFDRAAAAFKRNDGASAKRLGAAGREANERMKQLHQKAAEAIFEARNPQTATDVVDLHGLHVSEALERLPAALERAPVGKVRVLTGTGHHTKGTGRARLRPAVKKWLQDAGYFFEEVIDANEFVGSFIVEVKR